MFHLITSLIQKKKGLLDWLLLCGWEGRWAKPILTDSHWFMGDSTCTTASRLVSRYDDQCNSQLLI